MTTGGQGLVRVDLATGDRVNVSGGGVGAGPALVSARSLVVRADGSTAYVYDATNLVVFHVDIADTEGTSQVSNARKTSVKYPATSTITEVAP